MPPAILILVKILLGIVKIIQAAHPDLKVVDVIPAVVADIESLAHAPAPGTTGITTT